MRINTVTPPDVGSSHFAKVPRANINRSVFERSHAHKTAFDAGYLVPVFRDIAWPGDTFNLQFKLLTRLATPLRPFMDRVIFDLHIWAVPIRLLFDNWAALQGERKPDPDSSIDYVTPKLDLDGLTVAPGSVYDYMGFRQRVYSATDDDRYHALYLRAYNAIHAEQYRDQNLQDSVSVLTGDGPDPHATYTLLRRGKRHDYFTSALPWPQKGNAVSIPLGTTAPFTGTVQLTGDTPYDPMLIKLASNGVVQGGDNLYASDANAWLTDGNGGATTVLDPNGAWETTGNVDLSTATAVTINALRMGIATQHLLERDARGGTRLTEIIASHFGVISPDARMQRPELLGTASFDLNATPVPNTTGTTGADQGDLAAYANGFGVGSCVQSFTEHCIVLALVSARAPYTYQQGHRRDMRYSTRYDFMLPDFANLGEQGILNDEIFSAGTATDDEVWGYQERWAEMRYMPGQVSGIMNSDASASLDVWHLAQDFASLPALNADFIQENPPIDRVIAVPSEPHFLCDVWTNFRATRPLPVFSIPGLDRI